MHARKFLALLLVFAFAQTAMAEEELFVFGVAADCQYCDADKSGERHYRDSPDKLQAAVDHLNTMDLAFTVHLGDFIDKNFESFGIVLPIWKQLTMPTYHVLGNHDYAVADDRKHMVPERLGMPSRYYDFTVQGWRFVVLDGNDISFHAYPKDSSELAAAESYYAERKIASPRWNGAIGNEQLAWLRDVLTEATKRNESVVLMAHFPIYPENAHNLWNASELLAVIDEYPCVKAYLNGHNHAGNYGERNGVHYVTFKGMVDTTKNAYATVAISSTAIRIAGFGREEDRRLTMRTSTHSDSRSKP